MDLIPRDSYETKQYMEYLNVKYQRALRKSGKGLASKSLLPVFFIAICVACWIGCPFILYAIVKRCYYPDKEEQEESEKQSAYDSLVIETTTLDASAEKQAACSVGYGAGLIVAVVMTALVSIGLFIVCHRLYKRYAAEEGIVHAGAATIRITGTESAPPGKVMVIDIGDSYHMYFLSEDAMVRQLDERQDDCLKNIVTNCWFEEEANNDNRTEINDVQLSDYLYTVQNPLLWQKYQNFSVSRGHERDAGGYINLDCFGSEFDVKSLLTNRYIRDIEMALPSSWDQTTPRFTGKEGLLFTVVEVKEIIPIINKGLKLKKGPLGKGLYMYDNLKTAVEKPIHQLYAEPKCLLIVRARIENVCTLSVRPTYKKSDFKKYSVAVVETPGIMGREFVFFDASMCVPLFVAIYRRKFAKELEKTREAVFKMLNEEGNSV